MTRYQVIASNGTVQNFSATEKREAEKALAVLRKTDPKASFWDTQKNTMSGMFKF